ncbi:hypothetical protein PGT21_029927 [Puccinia graminis f. sp. tritici]|uniref:Uncharacterized protein n=1 Tax=Puccinia graminis f. sp. tritici TaxID=56615 RepID=A0A5B0PHM2_PUCGR|nr:hypothetical protein PGT21_029927 [Puccinia graminis f. sp. tritici]KAA1120707.1 hypothetical protein PGTUg99_024458 [Puccinia graminis f. sp. tritici]
MLTFSFLRTGLLEQPGSNPPQTAWNESSLNNPERIQKNKTRRISRSILLETRDSGRTPNRRGRLTILKSTFRKNPGPIVDTSTSSFQNTNFLLAGPIAYPNRVDRLVTFHSLKYVYTSYSLCPPLEHRPFLSLPSYRIVQLHSTGNYPES